MNYLKLYIKLLLHLNNLTFEEIKMLNIIIILIN